MIDDNSLVAKSFIEDALKLKRMNSDKWTLYKLAMFYVACAGVAALLAIAGALHKEK